MKKNNRPGSEFEEAVHKFAMTLDPRSEVLFNHHVPDRDTGELRQCDVWINARFGGHWPISILVSCKDHGRKLHVGDIGTFRDEVRSTGANTGVIYSRAGFTEPALRKAQANGFSCCQILRNEPASIPGVLYFDHYACSSQVRLALVTDIRDSGFKTWNDIFVLECEGEKLLDIICEVFTENDEKAVQEAKNTRFFPADWAIEIQTPVDESGEKIALRIFAYWKKYKARMEATMLNGSYCLTDKSFLGSQSGPWIDTQGEHPGEAWEEITGSDFTLPANRIIAVLYRADVKGTLQQKLGSTTLYPYVTA